MRKKEEILRKKETTIRRQNPKENKRGKYIQSVIKNKKLLAIMLVLVLVVLAIIVASNQEIRKNVIQAFNGEIQNAEEDEKIEVYENGSAILTDDAAIITSASVANRTTGTAPFDTDDEPGNDSSPDNDVIRSFDKITWEIEAYMEINNTGHGSEEANQYSQFRGGIINIEASLPEEYAGLVKWSLEDMTWAKETGTVSEDGLTFTAQYQMLETGITVPGKQTLSVVLQVLGAGNNTEINPSFKLWMQGNESNKENEGYEAIEIQDNLGAITVSAKGGYNIKIANNSYCTTKTNIDFGDGKGEVTGRIYGYGVILQLYGDNEEKGLKGIEAPKGDITFDINMKLEMVETIDGRQVTTDITEQAMPQLWNYKINIGTTVQNPAYGNIPDRNMYFGANTPYSTGYAPYGMAKTNRTNSIYNSGNIYMEQEGNTIKTTINHYAFDGIFPIYNNWYNSLNPSIVYQDNVGCFSAGYFQVFVPDNEITSDNDKTYYLTVEDTNMQIVTNSGEIVTEQKQSEDDSYRQRHYYIKPGTYNGSIRIYEDNATSYINGNFNSASYARGRKSPGQAFQAEITFQENSNNDIGTEIKSVNELIKFDGDGLEPILQADGTPFKLSQGKITEYNLYYLTKKDGTNWVSQEERNYADIEDFNIYNTLEDIPQGYICTGIYIEANIETENYLTLIYIRMKIKDTAEIGKTYGMVHYTDYYTETLDLTTQTIINPNATYPKAAYSIHNYAYKNIEYNQNGEVIPGTHQNHVYGNSLLVAGADSSIASQVIDEKTGEAKESYDLAKNENIVTFKVEPKLEELDEDNPAGVTGATITIKDTLSKGLIYIPGSSNYGEPIETITNEDGSTTLVFEKYNCNVGETIEPLTFKAQIDPSSINETTLTHTAVIEPDREKIGLTEISYRTATNEIKVVNLASHRIYQETDTQIIENNGEIKYKVTYENKTATSTPEFQLLDILPYNGDGRGSAYNGTYTLENVKVTQTGADGEISTDNLTLYTTTDIEARKITPKDENIGVTIEEGGIWEEKEIGEEINEAVTVLALKGEIAPSTKIEMEITIKTNNNRAGDMYANTVTAQTSKDTEVITTGTVETRVVKRQISGMIWYDTNENGIKDNNESYANRIEVELKKADGSEATDTNGNEIPNVLTDSNGEYVFSNLPMGEYIVEIQTEDKYRLTEANVGTNKEINSKFEEIVEGAKQSYVITNLNSIASPEILENNVNAGLVVKDAKIIVKYLEEDATPETDEDNSVLKEQDEITTYEKDGEQVKYKLGDSYSTEKAEIADYIVLRNSGNTSGTLDEEETVVTYYYAYNKQDIEVTKVWEDNGNQAGKRPTSIKVTLKDGNATVKETILTDASKNEDNENIWTSIFEGVAVYRENGEKINYTVDESENEGSLESYIKTIEGTIITNTFTQNTEKIEIPVTKVWNDNENKAGKRPENVTLILKREIKSDSSSEEKTYVEVTRQTINGTDNPGENANEWKYTFGNIAKYDENNDEINYVVEEIVPEFYTGKVEKVENTDGEDGTTEFTITNTFEVPNETINVEVTKIWNDNNNRAGKRTEEVTLVLTGKNAEGEDVVESKEITLTSANKVGESVSEENIWKGTITDLPKYDENADIINYELSEESLNNIFYTEANTTINQQTKTVTNRFEVPDDKIEIGVNKKWEDNNNTLGRRPESVTLYLTGNNQEYETTLTKANAIDRTTSDEEDTSTTWRGTIGNLPKYDVNGNEITYTVDERPIASEFYTKTGIDQGSKTITNTFGIPTESIQIPVTKIWEDNNNSKGYRPENIVLQIKEKGTGKVVAEQMVSGNKTTNEGWNYTFEVPKYNDQGEVVEYEIGERELGNKFYSDEAVRINQENRTITNVFTVPDEKIELTVNKVWVDNETQASRRPETIVMNVKAENGDNQNPEEVIATYELNTDTETSHTFTNLPRYNSEGDEVVYTVEEGEKTVGDLKFYTSSTSGVTNVANEENKKQATITNTFTRPNDITKIIVNKIWQDNETQAQRRPDSIVIVVKNGEQEVRTKEISKDDMVEVTTNQWSTTIEGLQKYDDNGEEIEYTVEEREKNSNDLKFYEAEEAAVTVEDNQATIRNTFVKPEDIISVTVNKVWNDNNDANGKRPESIKLQVKNGEAIVEEEVITEKNAVINEDITNTNEWTYTFTDLPKYDENGQEIAYTVSEEEVTKDDLKFYTNDSITGDMTSGYTITNTFTVPDERIDLTVNKEWSDNAIQAQRRPETIVINVKAENGDNQDPEEVIATYELNTETETSHIFVNLPKYNSQGNEIEYTVEEQEKNPGDLHFYTTVIGEVKNVNEDSKEVTITNTFEKPNDTTEVTITKVWNDNNNEAEKRPESIKLQLKNGNEVVKEQVITEQNAVLDGDVVNTNEWQYTFTDVEKYNGNGEEIVYTANETEVNNGDLQFYEKEIEGTTITNTFTHNTEQTSVTVTKKWEDNEVQAQRRPESVIVVLKANGQENERYELSEKSAETVNDNIWTYTFKDLAKYDENNNIINYTVEELEKEEGDLHFYTSKVDGTMITNTFTRPEDTTSITITKQWEDEENKYKKRPGSVEVEIKNGTQVVEEGSITEGENWQHTFTGLEKYDGNGQEIQYSVDEKDLTGEAQIYYTKSIQGTTITNTMTKTPGIVTVKYVDKYTDEEIANRVEKEGVVGEGYNVEEDKKEIAGYTLIKEPEEKEGTFTNEPQEKIYYYAKNTEVIVKYLEQDETEGNTDNKVVAEEIKIEGYEGKEYTTEEKTVPDYTFVEVSGEIEGTMTREAIEVIYYYSPNTQVTVKYIEQDNTPGDNSDNTVLDAETIQGYVGKGYETEEKAIPGYTFVKASENTEGTMTKEEIEVYYYYAQNTKVTVKYVEQDKTPDNNHDNIVLDTVVIEGYEGKAYETEQKEIIGYTFVEASDNTKGTMTKEEIEVYYYYAQNTSIKVQYIDKTTGEVLEERIEEGKIGDICKTEAIAIQGYVLVEEPANPNVEMTKEQQVVKYYYLKQVEGVIEKHVDIISGKILEEKTHPGKVGDSYKIEAKEFEGYDLVENALPENAEGEMTTEVIEVTYYYIKQASVRVQYLEKGTEKVLSEESILQGHENETYKTKAKEIEGYNLLEVPENATGKMEVTVNGDGTYNTETVVTYYYIKQAGGVIEKHIDINSGKVLEQEEHTGNVGDRYEIEPKEYEGYDLVIEDEEGNTKLPENAKGTMTEETIEVIYYYQKLSVVRVEYIDKYTGEKIAQEKIEGHVGEKYETEGKEFEGYDLTEIPLNSKGEMTEEETVVKYYYQRKTEVEIQYIEKETGYVIAEPETIEGHVGDAYETTAKNIDYYKLIGYTENTSGTMAKEKITVIYYYEKQTFNLAIDKWISGVSIDGIPQIGQSYENRDELYKIDIHRNRISEADVKVSYTIRITNTGEIEGTANKITEIIPKEFYYRAEDNKTVWKEEGGNLVTEALEKVTIQPGESKEIEIVLRWNNRENNLGEIKNTAIISGVTNPARYADMIEEDNSDTSDMLITIETGGLDSRDRMIVLIAGVQIVLAISIGLLISYKKKEK